ncbi:MAG: hypothetical protein INH41_27780 [Myxococcaceae bacterium]|jgi:hypothetical protein|nr:hypothetical protein [Myxococcaceae bacterium]
MKRFKSFAAAVAALSLTAVLAACGPTPSTPDAGGAGGGSAGGAGGGSGGGAAVDGGAVTFRAFTAPAMAAVTGAFLVTITAEESASEGFGFPPKAGSTEPFFIDGWEVKYEHLVTTVDNVTLSSNPDMNPNAPAMTGPVVARATGPWAIDLAKEGPVAAKEMEGKAFPLVRLTNQNAVAGTPAFSTTAKYAFGFDLVAADGNPIDVNLDADAKAAYQTMRANGWSYWVKGTATYRGAMGTPACRSTVAAYDYARIPKVVNFSFGWRVPASYKNCKNQELTPMDSRGVQLGANGAEAVAQVTLHNDHPFWDALEEDAPLRFDAIAARKSVPAGMTAPAMVSVTNADLQGVDLEALADAQGTRLPIRYCGATSSTERTMGALAYDPKGVPVNAMGGAGGLKDLYDYMAYNLSTLGHLNAGEGLCVVQRQYPSPQ